MIYYTLDASGYYKYFLIHGPMPEEEEQQRLIHEFGKKEEERKFAEETSKEYQEGADQAVKDASELGGDLWAMMGSL